MYAHWTALSGNISIYSLQEEREIFNMIKVSIIMPCLNVVRYIKPCIDSVLQQTLSNIEILIIDAGSTDGTLDILSEYEKLDTRIHIFHSEIKSYGYQMNWGISLASGEYIGIVETDDMIQPDMFEVLYSEAISENADYTKGTAEGFFQSQHGVEWRFSIVPCCDLKEKYVAVPKETPELFLYDNFLWNGIYRRKFLQNIYFNETPGAAFQDIGALFQIISSAGKGVYLNHLVYNYRQDNSGASSYHEKSFLYTATEYRYIEQFLPSLSCEWENIYYLKMGGLTINRFLFMAGSGHYWKASEAGIKELHKKLSYAVESGKVHSGNCLYWEELQLFLEGPYTIYESVRQKYCIKLDCLNTILKQSQHRKVYIFGAGNYGMFIHVFLSLNNVNVIAFCDNSVQKQNKIIQGLPVLAPEKTIFGTEDVCYIITVQRYIQEATDQLLQLGVTQDRITFYNAGIDMYLLKEFEKEK